MQDYRSLATEIAEASLSRILPLQIRAEGSPDLGGIRDPLAGLVNPGETSRSLRLFASVFLDQRSRYYLAPDIARAMHLALSFLERAQRPDGTFDLLTTNFFSAPDTGFMVHDLVYAYRLIDKCSSPDSRAVLSAAASLHSLPSAPPAHQGGAGSDEGYDSFASRLRLLIRRAGHGMCKGGFHTPNHRWVLAAALLMAHNVCGVEQFAEAANEYLAEGIDCNHYGEFTERSAGIYNATNDSALIILAEETGRSDLLAHVQRNLEMMLTYFDPDGTVFTQNSSRQDRSSVTGLSAARYLPLYLYMANESGDERFSAMAARIATQLREPDLADPDLDSAGFLHLLLLKPEFYQAAVPEGVVPTTYEAFYEESGIVRIRRDTVSLSLLRDNSSFFFFQVGELRCRMKICASFFAVAQFKAEKLYQADEGYILESKATGVYRLPFQDPPETSDWRRMNHSGRRIGTQVELATRVLVSERDEGVSVAIRTSGCDRVPIKVELCFSAPVQVCGEGFGLTGLAGQSMVVRSGDVVVSDGRNAMRVGPGFAAHSYTHTMRGSEPQSPSEFTVYFTDFTNIDREITLEALPSQGRQGRAKPVPTLRCQHPH